MKAFQISRSKLNKQLATITSNERFAQNLELRLTLIGEQALDTFDWGFIDLNYSLFDNFPERKRIVITYQDFLDPYILTINTGEILTKIQIGAYFLDNESHSKSIKIDLVIKKEPGIRESVEIGHLHEAILFGPTVEFLEALRSISDKKFVQIICSDLDNMKGRIDEASGRTFNYWALANRIRKIPNELMPQEFRHLKEKYYEEFKFGQDKLG